MRASPHENNQTSFPAFVKLVGQQEVAANMTFPVPVPVAAQGVIEPFRPEWAVIGDEQEHRLLELVHVIATGSGQTFPILQKMLGKIRSTRR